MNDTFMKTRPVFPLLLSMALPNVISMLVNSLYNIVDSLFVAQISEQAMTALSLVFPIQNFVNAVAIGFGIGINAQIALYLGAGDHENANRAATHGMMFSLLHGVLGMVLCIAIMPGFLRRFTTDPALVDMGVTYSTIVFLFATINMAALAFEKMFQAVGRMKVTMVALVFGCACNILLDPVLIFGLGPVPAMGIAGAAIATVIGQWVSGIMVIIFNLKFNPEVQLHKKYLPLEGKTVAAILTVGIPSIVMNGIGSVMNFGINQILQGFAETATGVFGVYFKLQSFVFMPVFGLNNGMVPIIAYNYGAQKPERIHKTIRLGMLYAVIIMALGFLVFQLIPKELLSMFDASDAMLEIGAPALRIMSLAFIFAGISIVAGSSCQAFGYSVYSMFISIARQIVVLIPAAYLLSLAGVLRDVWFAFPIAEIASLTLSLLFLRITLKKTGMALPKKK